MAYKLSGALKTEIWYSLDHIAKNISNYHCDHLIFYLPYFGNKLPNDPSLLGNFVRLLGSLCRYLTQENTIVSHPNPDVELEQFELTAKAGFRKIELQLASSAAPP